MRLPTRIHGMLDYLLAAALIALPWVLGFAEGGAETWVPVLVGLAIAAYSLVTEYELSAAKRMPMTAHLLLDALAGLLLAVSPWLFGFDERVWMPHVALGLIAAAAAAVTNTVPGYERRRAAH